MVVILAGAGLGWRRLAIIPMAEHDLSDITEGASAEAALVLELEEQLEQAEAAYDQLQEKAQRLEERFEQFIAAVEGAGVELSAEMQAIIDDEGDDDETEGEEDEDPSVTAFLQAADENLDPWLQLQLAVALITGISVTFLERAMLGDTDSAMAAGANLARLDAAASALEAIELVELAEMVEEDQEDEAADEAFVQ